MQKNIATGTRITHIPAGQSISLPGKPSAFAEIDLSVSENEFEFQAQTCWQKAPIKLHLWILDSFKGNRVGKLPGGHVKIRAKVIDGLFLRVYSFR